MKNKRSLQNYSVFLERVWILDCIPRTGSEFKSRFGTKRLNEVDKLYYL